MKRVKLLAESDVQEIVKFQQYLQDIGTLPPRDFVEKYQEYMGLSKSEAEAYIARETRGLRGQ